MESSDTRSADPPEARSTPKGLAKATALAALLGRRHPQRRWELTADEKARLVELRGEQLNLTTALRLIAGNPRVLAEVASSLKRSLRNSVFRDSALVWVIDSERIRRGIAADAPRGLAFADEQPFLDVLLPQLTPEQEVLELGCGDGRVARHAAEHVRQLTCSDVSRLMVREARENLERFPNVEVTRTRGLLLNEFHDEQFDLVFAQGVFSYLELNESLMLLDAARRILKPGGVIVANFFTIDNAEWLTLLLTALRRAAANDRLSAGLFKPYTSGYARELVEAAGFSAVSGTYPGDGETREPYVVTGMK